MKILTFSRKTIGIVTVVLFLISIFAINTISLYMNEKLLSDPRENAVIESTHQFVPIEEYTSETFDYFNHSLMFYDNNTIVNISVNSNFTNLTLINRIHVEPIWTSSGWIAVNFQRVTTNGKKIFVLQDGEYPITELEKTLKSTYNITKPLNITCQILTSRSCDIWDIKAVNNLIYILLDNSVVTYNYETKILEKTYTLPGNLHYVKINAGTQSNELWIEYQSTYGSVEGGFLRLNLQTGVYWQKIEFAISGPIVNPLFINNTMYGFQYNPNISSINAITTYSLQKQLPLINIGINVVTYGLILAVVIYRQKLTKIGENTYKKIREKLNGLE